MKHELIVKKELKERLNENEMKRVQVVLKTSAF